MAFYGKRRKPAGPSKNEQKLQRAEAEARRVRSAGSLADHFPQVERLIVSLQFLSPQGQVLSEEKRVFLPAEAYNISAPCPGRCGVGNFDLEAKVSNLVETRQPGAEASGVCQEPLYAGSPDVCGTKLQCKIEVVYLPEKSPSESQTPSAS